MLLQCGFRRLLEAGGAKHSPQNDELLKKRAAFQKEIERAMGTVRWDTHTPESMQERYAELA